MISGFFKRLTAEEYFQEVEKNASAPIQRTIKALIHSPPPSNDIPSPLSSPLSSNPSRRSSNVFLSVQDEIKVLEEVNVNVPQGKADLSGFSIKKRKKSISNPSDMESASNQPIEEHESEENSTNTPNKLTVRFKKKSRKTPIKKEEDSDSDIDLNFVEKDEKLQEEEGEKANVFCLMMSKQKSNNKSLVESTPKPNPVIESPASKSNKESPKQIDSEASAQKVPSSDGSLDFLKDVPKTSNKLKRPRSTKTKIVDLDESTAPPSSNEESPRRISTRIRNKRMISLIQDSSSSSDEEEEDPIKKAPRKKMKRKGVKGPSSKSLSSPSTLDKKAKLASIFVRECPEVSAARKAFLQSTAPEGIKRLREQEMSAEALGYDYFNDFSFVPHVNYVNSVTTKPSIHLINISDSKYIVALPKKPKLSWLLSSTQTEGRIVEKGPSYSLPLSNKEIYCYAQSEADLSRESLLNLMKREIKGTHGIPWTLKYAPDCSDPILGNHNHVSALKTWLNSFSTKNKSNFRDSDAESCSSLGEFGANAVILYGPHGCGKTSTVYALASELGLKILEVNASSYRSGRQFMNMTHEATQSHRVNRGGSDAQKGISALFKTKRASNEKPSPKNDSLILVEDIDLFFEDGDEGFYQALSGVIGTSKRPIILTYSSNKSKGLSIPLPKIDQIHSYHFKKVSPETTAQYLSSIALNEGYPVSLESLLKLVESFDGNIGQSLLSLEFFCLSSKRTTGSRISPSIRIVDTSLKEFLNISSCKSQIDQRPNALDLMLPTKGPTLSWCKIMHSKSSTDHVRKTLASRKYSPKDIKKMETLALNLENYSCDNEGVVLDDLRRDSAHPAGHQVLESLYKLPSKTSPYLHTDVLPVIRSLARIEEDRRNLNAKRRFLHYFHSQLELPISSEDLSLLRSTFQPASSLDVSS